MSKKGISPLIATVLLIGSTIALAALVMVWSQNLFKETTERTGTGIQGEIICSSDVQFSIESATGTTSPSTVRVINNAEYPIDNFIARVHKADGTIQVVSGLSGVDSFASNQLTITYTDTGEEIELIPIITLEDGTSKTCAQNIEKATLT